MIDHSPHSRTRQVPNFDPTGQLPLVVQVVMVGHRHSETISEFQFSRCVEDSDRQEVLIKFLHTMIRVNDLDESIKFCCDVLRMKLLRSSNK